MSDDRIELKGAAVPQGSEQAVTLLPRNSRPLLDQALQKAVGDESFNSALMKLVDLPRQRNENYSSQGVSVGQKAHPFDFEIINRFLGANVHHSRSIHAKVAAIVGLGFETPNDRIRKRAKALGQPVDPSTLTAGGDVAAIDEKLDPLCDHSWQDTLTDAIMDYAQAGNGYIEVVRNLNNEIVGLHHLPAGEAWVVIEDHRYRRHFAVQGREDASGLRLFARFGELDDFIRRMGNSSISFVTGFAPPDRNNTSEVIHFRKPTPLSRWYGFPDWLSAVASIELVQCLTQHNYDFFLNRGVPEFLLFLLGQKLSKEDRERIESAMGNMIGLGNQRKSALINLVNKEVVVQLEKLALESKSDGSEFSAMADSLALQIVTAHGVPPLLAGIQIPGKLGASNEMVQAMQAFQTLVVGPDQRLIRQTLRNTLGREIDLGLTAEDFVLNTITDEIDVQRADTMARMRQSPQEAEAEGRDLGDGVRKEFTDEERAELMREGMSALVERLMGRAA